MGLSIHYSGSFKQGESLSAMIEEVRDVAEVYNWKYTIFEENFREEAFGKEAYSEEVFGICFTPSDCETVSLTFLSNGKMFGVFNIAALSDPTLDNDFLHMVFVKTQYAGIEIHKLLIHLFKHISKKYFTNFELIDEGQYWETGNEKLLEEMFQRYTDMIESFSSALDSFPRLDGESFEDYFGRLGNKVWNRKRSG